MSRASEFQRYYTTTGDTVFSAVEKLPKLGSVDPEFKGMACVSYDIVPAPRGFFDWLFGRQNQWAVTASFIPIDDLFFQHGANASNPIDNE